MVVERVDVVSANRHRLLLGHQALDRVVLDHLSEAVVSLPWHAINRLHLLNLLFQGLILVFKMLLVHLEFSKDVAEFVKFLVQLGLLLLHLFEFKVFAGLCLVCSLADGVAVAVDRLALLILSQ